MGIDAGSLNRRVVILRAADVDDGLSTVPGVHAEIARRWAKKTDVSDAERLRASETGQELTTRFLMRADAITRTIRGSDRLVCRNRTYEVTGSKEVGDDGIEVTTASRNDRP